jgi:hypothetical protein
MWMDMEQKAQKKQTKKGQSAIMQVDIREV